jgi:hypothetical protein
MAQIIVNHNGHTEPIHLFTSTDVASCDRLHKEIRITAFSADHSEQTLYRIVFDREEAIKLLAQLATQIANI